MCRIDDQASDLKEVVTSPIFRLREGDSLAIAILADDIDAARHQALRFKRVRVAVTVLCTQHCIDPRHLRYEERTKVIYTSVQVDHRFHDVPFPDLQNR